MENSFDIVIIGSGPGGYTAAIRCAQLGYRTAIVEKYPVLGGTCTNVGCIPSKAMLDSTEQYHSIIHKASIKGMEGGDTVRLNFQKLVQRNKEVVRQNTNGLQYLMKKNRITVFTGKAAFNDNRSVSVTSGVAEKVEVHGRYFIIATGSKPSSLPGVKIDKQRIITSTEALFLSEKPGSLLIIGGGVIGVEMASVFSRIGVDVTIMEYSSSLIPAMDKELAAELQRNLTKLGVRLLMNTTVQSARNEGKYVTTSYLDNTQKKMEMTSEYCLLAVGRRPYTDGLELQNTNVNTDKRGYIVVDDQLQTGEKNIYAIGDVVGGLMLAHKAEDEAVFVADNIAGQTHNINYSRIPSVIYTAPEVAGVGLTEEQLIQSGIKYKKGKFSFLASGRARASDETTGFVKVLCDARYGEVLGVHIIGARAADLIAQGVLAMSFEITDVELAKVSYAHPTFSEALKEAYLFSSDRGSINS